MKIYERSLGDGLYAEFDGYHIILKTQRDTEEHYVALEPEVFSALIEYEKDLREKLGKVI